MPRSCSQIRPHRCGELHLVQAKLRRAGVDFEYCAYGLRVPLPVGSPTIHLVNNYPLPWQRRYADCDYVACDPTVSRGLVTGTPMIWEDALFSGTPALWNDVRDAGIRVGWAQSAWSSPGDVRGLVTFARSDDPIDVLELEAVEHRLRWLVSLLHAVLSRRYLPAICPESEVRLTERERTVLRMCAAGLRGAAIAWELRVSERTVLFHMGNACRKLGAPTRASAVATAALLGFLW